MTYPLTGGLLGPSIQVDCILKLGRRGERDRISEHGSRTPRVHKLYNSSYGNLYPHGGRRISYMMNDPSPNCSVSVYWPSTCARHMSHLYLPSSIISIQNEQNCSSIPKRTAEFPRSIFDSSLAIFHQGLVSQGLVSISIFGDLFLPSHGPDCTTNIFERTDTHWLAKERLESGLVGEPRLSRIYSSFISPLSSRVI